MSSLSLPSSSYAEVRPAKRSKSSEATVKGQEVLNASGSSQNSSRSPTPIEILNAATGNHELRFENNPFGLKDKAETWLAAELRRSKRNDMAYSPHFSTDGKVPIEHFGKAFKEFWERKVTGPSVVLVAVNVDRAWEASEAVGKARFLLFPELGEHKESALFLTYMPGPEHGAIDSLVTHSIGHWQLSNPILTRVLNFGQSSGGKNNYQPDKSIFPMKRNRDGSCDSDKTNKKKPFSRFYWEVEVHNRDPVELRQRGFQYMKCPYTRLYLAAKIFFQDEEEAQFAAAMVLWGKDETTHATQVLDAVSFGTRDLSNEERGDFSKAGSDMLIGVTDWRRLVPANVATTTGEWRLRIPFRGVLYKVKGDADAAGNPYLLDILTEGQVNDITIDLHVLYSKILDVEADDEEEE